MTIKTTISPQSPHGSTSAGARTGSSGRTEEHFRRAAAAIHLVLSPGATAELARYTERTFPASEPARDGLSFEAHNREIDAIAAILWQWGHPVVIKVIDR
jgi:hypothetical protein